MHAACVIDMTNYTTIGQYTPKGPKTLTAMVSEHPEAKYYRLRQTHGTTYDVDIPQENASIPVSKMLLLIKAANLDKEIGQFIPNLNTIYLLKRGPLDSSLMISRDPVKKDED